MSDFGWNTLGHVVSWIGGAVIAMWVAAMILKFIAFLLRKLGGAAAAVHPEAMARKTGELVATVKRGYKQGHGE